MSQLPFCDAIEAAAHEMTVEIARPPEQVLEAQRLRYKVYCKERGFEAGNDGLEQDAFDASSEHVLVRIVATGNICGTARVVCSTSDAGHDSFPMQRVCDRYVLAPLPPSGTGE